MVNFDTGLSWLDSVLDGGAALYSKTLDRQIATQNAKAANANSLAEQYRAQAVGLYQDAVTKTVQVGNVTIPTWTLVVGAGALGLAMYLKKK